MVVQLEVVVLFLAPQQLVALMDLGELLLLLEYKAPVLEQLELPSHSPALHLQVHIPDPAPTSAVVRKAEAMPRNAPMTHHAAGPRNAVLILARPTIGFASRRRRNR